MSLPQNRSNQSEIGGWYWSPKLPKQKSWLEPTLDEIVASPTKRVKSSHCCSTKFVSHKRWKYWATFFWITICPQNTICRRITVHLVSILTISDMTNEENMLLFVCSEADESNLVKLETRHTVILPFMVSVLCFVPRYKA